MRREYFLGFLIGAACGPDSAKQPDGDEPERYAESFCSASNDCGCQPHYGDGQACRDFMESRFSEALDAGLTLDIECFEQVIDRGGLDECSPVVTWSYDDWYCKVLRGNKKRGEACDPLLPALPPFAMDDCESGLRCLDAVCVTYDELLPTHGEGEACSAEEPLSCHNMFYCSSKGICETPPREGDACEYDLACLPGMPDGSLYCAGLGGAGVGTCSKRLAEGQPCDPRDTLACFGDDAFYGWCDPSTSTCREKGPAVCSAIDYQVTHAGGVE